MRSPHPTENVARGIAGRGHTAGIVLAAGGSTRLGTPKQLCNWQDEVFICQVIKTALEAGITPLSVVTGAYQEIIENTLKNFHLQVVHNPDWASGVASSMRTGLFALPQSCESVIFFLSDQPQVSPVMIRQLIERYFKNQAPITAPLVAGQRGNPVLFERSTFITLMELQGDRGGRAVFSQFNVDWLPWIDDRVLMDVDEQEEEQALMDAFFPPVHDKNKT